MSKSKVKSTYKCSECGSLNVEVKVWMRVNTKEVDDSVENLTEQEIWCPDCEAHVELEKVEE